MTYEHFAELYKFTAPIVIVLSGLLVGWWKYMEMLRTKIRHRSVGAQAVLNLMEHLNTCRADIDRLKQKQNVDDDERKKEIYVLEQDYKRMSELIINILKNEKL